MTADITALRIDVADLLAKPAARRPLHLEVPVDGLAGSAAWVRDDEPIVLHLMLERVPEGIVVRGNIRARWRAACSVCLTELDEELTLGVNELFEAEAVEGDTYPLVGHQLDLEQLVRDAVLVELPLAPTCESIGLGPCTNEADANRQPPPPDPRWSVLSELDL